MKTTAKPAAKTTAKTTASPHTPAKSTARPAATTTGGGSTATKPGSTTASDGSNVSDLPDSSELSEMSDRLDSPDGSDGSDAAAPVTTKTWQNPADRTTAADKTPAAGSRSDGGYKWIATWIVLGLGVLTGGILWLLKKRHFKNYLAVLVLLTAIIALVWLTDIQTTDDYYAGTVSAASESVGTVTMTIRCDALGDRLTEASYLPGDGIILPETGFAITEGETVFDLLDAAARAHRIQVDSRGVQVGTKGSVYVSGIAYLYEFDFGELSGWMYRVNGDTPSVGCGEYELQPGDRVEWVYSVNMGRDLSE